MATLDDFSDIAADLLSTAGQAAIAAKISNQPSKTQLSVAPVAPPNSAAAQPASAVQSLARNPTMWVLGGVLLLVVVVALARR